MEVWEYFTKQINIQRLILGLVDLAVMIPAYRLRQVPNNSKPTYNNCSTACKAILSLQTTGYCEIKSIHTLPAKKRNLRK